MTTIMRSFSHFALALFTFLTLTSSAGAQIGSWAPIGPTNATVISLQQDPFTSSTLYAGVYFGGIFKSTDGGAHWVSLPSPFTSDVVFTLTCDPSNQGTLYAGTFQHGLFKTTNGGSTWTSINQGIATMDDEAFGVDPTNSQILLLGSGGNGYRSTNGGTTWTPLSLNARTIFFDPVHADTVYVGTYSNGLMKSVDDGATFTSFTAGIGQNTVLSIHESQDGSSLYAAALQGIFEIDQGQTQWTNITGNLPWNGQGDILSLPQAGNTLVAGGSQGVYTENKSAASPAWTSVSTIGTRFLYAPLNGNIWVASSYEGLYATANITSPFTLSETGIQNYFVEALAAVSAGGGTTVFAGTDHGVFNETAGGSWGNSPDLTQQTIFALRQHPTQSSTVYAGTQTGGVWQTTDLGAHWSSLANGMVPRQVTSVAQFVDVKQVVLAGTTSGVFQSLDNGKTWNETLLLAGIHSMATDPSIQASAYIGAESGQVLHTTDYGQTFNPVQAAGLPASDVLGLTVIPFDKTYAVLANGQAWATYTGGSNWLQMNASSPYPITCVTGDPNNIKTAYMGTSGGGIYVTSDFGATWTQVNNGLSGLYVYTIAVDPTNSNNIYAATNLGVYKTTTQTSSWQLAGTGLPAQPVLSMVIDAQTPLNLTVSILNQGVYRTTDGGMTWLAAASGPPSSGVLALALNPLFPATVYAGSLLQGIYVSYDSGNTWQASNSGLSVFVRGVLVDPTNPGNMYAASLSDGFFRSTNSGASWSNVGLNDRNLFGIGFDPTNTQIIYAASSIGVAKSIDAGTTWQDLGQHNPYLFSMVVDPNNSQTIYTSSTQGNVYKSTDGGQTWSEAGTGLPLGDAIAIAINKSSGALYAAINLNGVYTSTNGGVSWMPCGTLGALKTVSTTGLSVDGNTGSIYISGSSVGVFRSTDNCQNWASSNSGVVTANVQSVLASQHTPSLVFAGTAGAGIYRSTDGATTWNPVVRGPTGTVVISIAEDPAHTGVFYLGTDTGLFRSADSGLNWTSISTGLPSGVGISAILPTSSNTLYAVAGQSGLYMSSNLGTSWTSVSTPVGTSVIRSLGMSSNSLTLYAATLGAGFISSTNSGSSWTPAISLANVETVTNVVIVDPRTPLTVYAATGGSGVQKSLDGGITWQAATTGLTQLYVVAMIMDPTNSSILYAGTAQGGVFVSKDGANTWSPLLNGLYDLNVVSLTIDPSNHNIIYAGTEGAGVFRLQTQ